MTKESYFQMCEAMGTEPNPDEIPVEYGDFPQEVQDILDFYSMLEDRWEGMSGTFMGKSTANFKGLFQLLNISPELTRYYLRVIMLLDSIRSEMYAAAAKAKQSTTK